MGLFETCSRTDVETFFPGTELPIVIQCFDEAKLCRPDGHLDNWMLDEEDDIWFGMFK